VTARTEIGQCSVVFALVANMGLIFLQQRLGVMARLRWSKEAHFLQATEAAEAAVGEVALYVGLEGIHARLFLEACFDEDPAVSPQIARARPSVNPRAAAMPPTLHIAHDTRPAPAGGPRLPPAKGGAVCDTANPYIEQRRDEKRRDQDDPHLHW
jgi:hypothetical protein